MAAGDTLRRSVRTGERAVNVRQALPGVNEVWDGVARVRSRTSSHAGSFHSRATARATSAAWLKPRARCFVGASGTGSSAARSATTSRGQASRAIRCAITSATDVQPSYLSAETIALLVGCGSQQYDRAARTNGASSGHTGHAPRTCRGCPQRAQCGAGSSGTRAQQRPQTTPASWSASKASHAAQARGSSN